jgi:transcriptional regulator with XRE-family HTH domain
MTPFQRNAEIGRRIAAIRKHRHMTERQLGDAIGRSRQAIWFYEHGIVGAALLAQLDAIAAALDCTRDDLLAPVDAPLPPRPRPKSPRPRSRFRARERMIPMKDAVVAHYLANITERPILREQALAATTSDSGTSRAVPIIARCIANYLRVMETYKGTPKHVSY